MFNGPGAVLIVGQTAQKLTFQRSDVTADSGALAGQLTGTFKDIPTLTDVWCDVQPMSGSRILNTRLASMYAQMFDIIVSGVPDVRRNDRVEINDALCVVESVTPLGGHTEVQAGAIE